MDTLLNRLKNEILTSIQADGGISGGMDEEQFEAMLDEAIFEETHVTVIFHTASGDAVDDIEGHGGFFFDYEGTDPKTGNPTGTRIIPNEDGDYIVEGVEIGTTHYVYHSLYDTSSSLEYGTDEEKSKFYIDKDNHEFYSLAINAQVITQQEI